MTQQSSLKDVDSFGKTEAERIAYLAGVVADLAIMNAQQVLLLDILERHLADGEPFDDTRFNDVSKQMRELFAAHAAEMKRLAMKAQNG